MEKPKKTNTKINPNPESTLGFTLIELLIALFISGVILALGAAGTTTLYQSENKLNRKSSIRIEISRALSYIKDEIESSVSVEIDNTSDCTTDFANGDCLKITNNDGTTILYGFKDINSISSSNNLYKWLKPGILRRKEDSGSGYGNADVLIDGLAVTGITIPTCSLGTTMNNNQGFQFCLGSEPSPKKRVEIFLFGYTGQGSSDTPIQLNTSAFAKSQ
jgi:prepilin-type N-terminal cleavage/methylation domain-containing protein